MQILEPVQNPQPDLILPYKRLMQAVIIQAMKDYISGEDDREVIKRWVRKRSGTFNLCVEAWDRDPEKVQVMMLGKMREIDSGVPLVIKLKKTRR